MARLVSLCLMSVIYISSGHDTYFYQLFMDKDDRVLLPTTQQLLELSFMQSDVKLSEVWSHFFYCNDPGDSLSVETCIPHHTSVLL